MALTSDEAEYIEHLALRIRRGDFISADLPWIPAEGDRGAGRPSLITEREVARICLTCKKPRCTGMCQEYLRAKNDLIARAREELARAAGGGIVRRSTRKGGRKNDG